MGQKKKKPKQKKKDEGDIWKLKEMLTEYGLSIQTVAPDGNCLFRAFALQHCGEEDRHCEYRQTCCDYLSSHSDDFKQFHDSDTETFEQYLDKMKEDATWGSQMELSALCSAYGVSAVVFQADGVHLELGLAEPSQPTVLISFHDDEHFNAVTFFGDELETLEEIRLRIKPGNIKSKKVVNQNLVKV